MHILWQLLPIWDLWLTLCSNLGFLFSLLTTITSLNIPWTAPVSAGILAEVILLHHTQQDNRFFTPAGHICNSGLCFCSLWCTVWEYGEPSTATLSSLQGNLWLIPTALGLGSCGKIQNWKSQNVRPLLQDVGWNPKHQKKMQIPLPVSKSTPEHEHQYSDTERRFPGANIQRSQHRGPFMYWQHLIADL